MRCAQARVFLNGRLPAAPRVPIPIAHLAGAGGYKPAVAAALEVFVEAIGQDERMKNALFDVTAVVDAAAQPAKCWRK